MSLRQVSVRLDEATWLVLQAEAWRRSAREGRGISAGSILRMLAEAFAETTTPAAVPLTSTGATSEQPEGC